MNIITNQLVFDSNQQFLFFFQGTLADVNTLNMININIKYEYLNNLNRSCTIQDKEHNIKNNTKNNHSHRI